MVLFITLTTITHALLFAYDEYFLKRKRNLSVIEINSSLLDGILYIGLVAMTIFTTYSETLSSIYIAVSVLSCLSILKNELIYPLNINRDERIVHACLYVLHPLILYCFYHSWSLNFFHTNMTYWLLQLGYLVLGFKTISYHVIYWHYIHQK
jgi:hypothetical protein